MSPGKRKAPEGTGADAITRPDLPPKSIEHTNEEGDGLGFFREAMSGKVRPGVREPRVSHYMCDCCRWSA